MCSLFQHWPSQECVWLGHPCTHWQWQSVFNWHIWTSGQNLIWHKPFSLNNLVVVITQAWRKLTRTIQSLEISLHYWVSQWIGSRHGLAEINDPCNSEEETSSETSLQLRDQTSSSPLIKGAGECYTQLYLGGISGWLWPRTCSITFYTGFSYIF